MEKSRLVCLFGVIIVVLCSAINVRGQSESSSTPSSTDLPQGSSLPATPENSSTTSDATSSSTGESGSPTTSDPELANCNTPTDLKTYCADIMTQEEMDYFNDTSIYGVMAEVLQKEIIYALQEQCVPGNWCLADSYQDKISKGRSKFYSTPVCQSDNLWMCLEFIEIQRRECNENDLFFLMSAIGLMCDMEAIDGGYISSVCYTRSQEALHVLYSDFSRDPQDMNRTQECSNYNKQMTNTYACAIFACDFEQRPFLKDFAPWERISGIAQDVLDECDVSVQCHGGNPTQNEPVSGASSSPQNPIPQSESESESESESTSGVVGTPDGSQITQESDMDEELAEMEAELEEEELIEEIENELFGTTRTYYDYTTEANENENENGGEGSANEQGMDVPESQEEVDNTFVYGMVTVTVVVVISLTLVGVMTFKRFSKIRKNYKLGYSQMTEEESRMLRNEYN